MRERNKISIKVKNKKQQNTNLFIDLSFCKHWHNVCNDVLGIITTMDCPPSIHLLAITISIQSVTISQRRYKTGTHWYITSFFFYTPCSISYLELIHFLHSLTYQALPMVVNFTSKCIPYVSETIKQKYVHFLIRCRGDITHSFIINYLQSFNLIYLISR